jgi:ubiquinol-cytochrome c reductase cytochrome b subunit
VLRRSATSRSQGTLPSKAPASREVHEWRGFVAWLEERVPLRAFVESQLTHYYAPKNLNFWYYFGVLALVVLASQYATGIVLAMYYKPGEATAFDSVEYIMREVPWGWLIRYVHSTGASAFFVIVYLHIFRTLLYGSYQRPRELVWILGMLAYFALMAEAFMGYVLPWGNLSYWGAQVIVSLLGTIPGIGPALVDWVRGDYAVSETALGRFFSLHVVAVPLALALLVALHLVALRTVGSNNPEGVEIKGEQGADGKPRDGVPFHPYHTVKDLLSVAVFLLVFAAILFFVPMFGGKFLEPENFEPANATSTPEHIAPLWYFAPYYAILRAVPDQRLGALLMLLAVVSFVFLPWLDRSPVRSIRYKGRLSRVALSLFAISFLSLGYLGLQPAEGKYIIAGRAFTLLYFAYFWLMPVYSKLEDVKTVPVSVR